VRGTQLVSHLGQSNSQSLRRSAQQMAQGRSTYCNLLALMLCGLAVAAAHMSPASPGPPSRAHHLNAHRLHQPTCMRTCQAVSSVSTPGGRWPTMLPRSLLASAAAAAAAL
jgi:hypothetical protein